jgi:5-methylcytosine-specific restriction protein B
MDAAVAQKLLPKLHGSRRKLEKVLFKLGDLCYTDTAGECEDLFKKPETIDFDNARYPISFEKIARMHKGLVENGFTSFAEA